MKQIWILTKRELQAYFDSLMAYILLVLFLGFSGFFTWIYGSDVFFVKQASLIVFFNIAYWTLFFFIPALTMRLLSEENHSGTIELLLTKPVTDWQVIVAKFLSALLLIFAALILTLPYYFTVSSLGNVDHGAVFSGYLALLLVSAMYIAIGLFTSSVTGNQIVAYLLALSIGIFFQIIFQMLSTNLTGVLGQVTDYLSVSSHFESMIRGVIDSRDIIYFISVIFLGLVSAESMLLKRRYI